MSHTADQNVRSSKCSLVCGKKTVEKYIPVLSWLPHYCLEDLKGDMIAGFTVGLTVVPQGLALAQLACLPPQYGLYTAFMGSFMYAIFGTCKDLVIGPTSVMALMTSEYAQLGGTVYAVLLTFLCGCLQLLFGFLNLGFLVNFISSPVLSGFMSSAALMIAITQIKGLFGLKFKSSGFIDMVYKTFYYIPETNFYDMGMGLSSISFLLLLRHFKDKKFKKGNKLPLCVLQSFETIWWSVATARNAILVVLCSGLASTFLAYEVDVFTLTQHVEAGLPPFKFPQFSLDIYDSASNSTIYKDPFEVLRDLGSGAVVVPFLSLLEAIAIAKAFSKSRKLDATREIVALGMGNLMGSFVSSYPVTGSFSRSVINNSSGVRTPLGGIFSGSLVLLALGVIAPSFHYIPKACLSAIIFSAVIFMIHYKDIPAMWHTSRLELIPFFTTFVCSLTLGLEYGLLLGVAVALGMLLYKQNKPHVDIEVIRSDNGYIKIYFKPDRSIYFPSIEYIKGKVTKVLCENKVYTKCIIIVDCDNIMDIDYSAVMGLRSMVQNLKKDEITTAFKITKPSVLKTLSSLQGLSLIYQREQDLDMLTEGDDCCDSSVLERNAENECNSIQPLLIEATDGNGAPSVGNNISDDQRANESTDNTLENDIQDCINLPPRL